MYFRLQYVVFTIPTSTKLHMDFEFVSPRHPKAYFIGREDDHTPSLAFRSVGQRRMVSGGISCKDGRDTIQLGRQSARLIHYVTGFGEMICGS